MNTVREAITQENNLFNEKVLLEGDPLILMKPVFIRKIK